MEITKLEEGTIYSVWDTEDPEGSTVGHLFARNMDDACDKFESLQRVRPHWRSYALDPYPNEELQSDLADLIEVYKIAKTAHTLDERLVVLIAELRVTRQLAKYGADLLDTAKFLLDCVPELVSDADNAAVADAEAVIRDAIRRTEMARGA